MLPPSPSAKRWGRHPCPPRWRTGHSLHVPVRCTRYARPRNLRHPLPSSLRGTEGRCSKAFSDSVSLYDAGAWKWVLESPLAGVEASRSSYRKRGDVKSDADRPARQTGRLPGGSERRLRHPLRARRAPSELSASAPTRVMSMTFHQGCPTRAAGFRIALPAFTRSLRDTRSRAGGFRHRHGHRC